MVGTASFKKPAFFSGQVGVQKGTFMEKVRTELEQISNIPRTIRSVGQEMYRGDLMIPRGEILKLPQAHLNALRRGVMQRIITDSKSGESQIMLNSHASFRWTRGPMSGHDGDEIRELNPGIFINVLENFHVVAARLAREHKLEHSLIDVLVARELDMLMTRELAFPEREEPDKYFLVARGPNDRRANAVAKLIDNPGRFKIYPSFPMTHVMGKPDIEARINQFRDRLAEKFIVFDPADIDEKGVLISAAQANQAGKEEIEVIIDDKPHRFSVKELLAVEKLADQQICSRDFGMIEQSNAIVSLFPTLADGGPAISSGVERELHHAHTLGKLVFVVWLPKKDPSPFVTNHVTKWFRSEEEAFSYFEDQGLIKQAA